MTIDFFAAFAIGFLGSGHCLGMCGGITTMLTTALSPQTNASTKSVYVALYNIGRILSYSIAGAIVGFTGSLAAKSIGLPLTILQAIAAMFLILLGLYLGQWLQVLSKVEVIGKVIWQHLSKLNKKILPVNSAPKALSLGLIWGWLPCGLVYSTLTWSLASGSASSGALIMLGFGLGTLPALIAMSFSVELIKKLITNLLFRKAIGALMVMIGALQVYNLV